MRNFINKLFLLSATITILLLILVSFSWLFDSEPVNLWNVFGISCNTTIILFLFYLLFGGKRN